jgi:hypothetical protein
MNPYVFVVDDIPHWDKDPMIRDHWVNNPCPYGFLFAELARFLCQLGHGSLWKTILLFKGSNVVAHLLTAGLVWLSAKKLQMPRPEIALYLYGWNPLILLHEIANGHNDLLMGALLTLSAYLIVIEAWLWVLPALMGAILIKYAPAVILPLTVLFLWKRAGWKETLRSSGLALVTLLLIGMPYLVDWQDFKLTEIGSNATLSHNSLQAMIFHSYEALTKLFRTLQDTLPMARTLLKSTLWFVFLGWYGTQMFRLIKEREISRETFFTQALLTQFILIAVVSSKFYAWYLAMFFPLIFFLPDTHWLRRLVLLITLTGTLSLTAIGQAHIANYIVMVLAPGVWMYLKYRQKDVDSKAAQLNTRGSIS